MTDAVKMAIEALTLARPIVESDYHEAKEHCDADWEGISKTALDAIDAALEQAGEPHVLQDGFEAEYDDDALTIRFPIGYAITARASGDMIVTRYPRPDDWRPLAVNITEIQRLGQEFDAGEVHRLAHAWLDENFSDVPDADFSSADMERAFLAGLAQSRGQAFDGEGEGFAIGDPVEKFTGEAIWHGIIVASYLTSKGKRRYVVEVKPQGFQMIAVPSQLRAASQKGDE